MEWGCWSYVQDVYPICTLGVGMCAMCQLCAESVLVLGRGGVTGLRKRVRTET